MMRAVKMRAKKAGTCRTCGKPIGLGQMIWWQRGAGAGHVDCQTAALQASMCSSCGGSGRLWNNAPCRACDGTGADMTAAREAVRQREAAQAEQRALDVDRMYEDDCARRCGL